jgi:hypothetical protein
MLEDCGGMAFGFDEGPDVLDFAGLADEERAADDAYESAAHELFFLPGAELLDSFVSGIAEQGEIEILLGLEGGLGLDRIGAHAEDGDAKLVEILFCVAKLGRFDGSTGSVGFGVEEEKNALAGEVFERDFIAFVGLEAEGGGFGAYFEHRNSFAIDLRTSREREWRASRSGRGKLRAVPTTNTQYTSRCFRHDRNLADEVPEMLGAGGTG